MLQIENESNLQEQKIIKDPLIEIKELPSGFKPYPKNSKVFYKPITLKELDILNSGSLNIEQGYQFLLDSIVTQGFDKNELAYFDVVYIGIQRKLTAFGDIKGKYELICPKCGQTIEYEFEYTSLEFKELQVDELPIKLKLNNEELHFSVLNIKDFLQIEDVDKIIDVYARMVKNKSYEEAHKIIENLTGKEAKAILYLAEILDYGIKPLDIICKNKIEKEIMDDKNNKKIITEECNEHFKKEIASPFEVTFPEDTYVDLDQFKV